MSATRLHPFTVNGRASRSASCSRTRFCAAPWLGLKGGFYGCAILGASRPLSARRPQRDDIRCRRSGDYTLDLLRP
jgi:hypothetical protein